MKFEFDKNQRNNLVSALNLYYERLYKECDQAHNAGMLESELAFRSAMLDVWEMLKTLMFGGDE